MDRRHLLMGLPGMFVARFADAQASNTVQLFLQRDSKEPISCNSDVKYIRGNLYGVPKTTKLEDVVSTLGLTHISRTEELPYLDNAKNISSIPAKIYDADIRTDRTKKWMNNDERAWRLELRDTAPRSAIQFHYGKDYKWSEGCIILTGNATGDIMCSQGSDSPEEAVATLRDYVLTGGNSITKIRIKIAFA